MAEKSFAFICGSDDFVVDRLGRARFEALSQEVPDELSREVLSGFAGNVSEVESAVARFREAVQTVDLFGGRRLVWLKDVNFLGDSVTGRAEGTLRQVELLQATLQSVKAEEALVLITANPVDRRRSFLKWCEANADFQYVGDSGRGGPSAAEGIAREEASACGISFSPGAMELLLAKTGGNSRLVVEEVRKIANYLGEEGSVADEGVVVELVASFGEGDFFEAAEAFFSRDLTWSLAAIRRHFFAGNEARSLLAALQNRNRLLIQLKCLLDGGEVRLGPRGLDKTGFERASSRHGEHFGEKSEKSPFNVFTQNPWYAGKLAAAAAGFSLRRLIDNQQAFVAAFEEIVARPDDQEEILRHLAVRCLT